MTFATHYAPANVNRLFGALPSVFADSVPLFRVDVSESENDYRIQAELPGVQKDDISIKVQDQLLTIAADFPSEQDDNSVLRRERLAGNVARSFRLSSDIAADDINASLDAGILTLTLPKGDNQRQRTIAIN